MFKFKKIQALLLALVLSLTLTACSEEVTDAVIDEVVDIAISEVKDALAEEDISTEEVPDYSEEIPQEDVSAPDEEVPVEEETPPAEEAAPAIDEDGYYTTKEDVALYIYTYGHLPDNFITKKEAEKLGWPGGELEPYAPGCCIGGDHFGNYEGLLPEDTNYIECDIDTMGAKKRGAKRMIFSEEGYIYYTDDHYESFTQLWFTDDYELMEEEVE